MTSAEPTSDRRSWLEKTGPFGLSTAMLVLMGFFFILPSAFRGARMGLKNKENDVKDWLPADFPETAELDWFAEHFAGESFVLATWPGCTEDDQRLRLLETKLLHESAQYREQMDDESWTLEERRTRLRARSMGDELGLLQPGENLTNWGGENEKWLISGAGTWYYLTPDGRLYRWDEPLNGPASLVRSIKKALGLFELRGQLVTAFGKPSTPQKINPFYNDPSLLCAPLFETVQTGATIAQELSAEGGPLWPIDLTDDAARPKIARRRALDQLTGTLFAPAVPPDFDWTPEAFEKVFAATEEDENLRDDWPALVLGALTEFATQQFESEIEFTPASAIARIQAAPMKTQTDAWYAVLDRLEVPTPPRLTCLLVTLTDIAKDNLSYAIGRGTMGMPRGRLLELAAQCGVHPPSPPSMAPPPFDRPPPISVGGLPPLRMGGPPIDNIAIDEEGTVTLVRLVGYCILLGIGLSYACFRSIKVTIMLFLVGGSSAMLAMAIVGWTGGRVDAILLSMPSLVYVLGLSGAIHVINYYRDEVRFRGRRGAAARAMHHALFPCALAALTTAIGLASLFTSNLKPISNFGLYAALGVLSTLGVLFSYLPSALEIFAPRFRSPAKPQRADATNRQPTSSPAEPANATRPSNTTSDLAKFWAAIGRWITRHHVGVSAVCLTFLALASLGVLKIKTSVQLLKLFDEDARILQDYAWLEENFGKLVPMEILVRMPPEIQREWQSTADPRWIAASQSTDDAESTVSNPVQLTLLERLETIRRIRIVVTRALGEEGMDVVGQASSMDTFLAPMPVPTNRYSSARSLAQRKLMDGREDLLRSDYVKIERGGPMVGSELWRLSLRVSALSDVDYGLFINDLKTSVLPVSQAYQIRAALLDQLAAVEGGISGRQRVLVLGSQPVEDLATAKLIEIESDGNEQGNAPEIMINQRAILLSTLHELLAGERIKTPIWVDPASPDARITPASESWDRFLTAFDAIIDVRDLPLATSPEVLAGLSDQDSVAPTPQESIPADRTVVATTLLAEPIEKSILATGRDQGGLQRVPMFAVDRPDTPQVVFTGLVPVVYKAQRTLLGSLVESIMLAFVLIALVMFVLLNPAARSLAALRPGNLASGLAAGAVSMIPNAFPVLVVFGMMGHLESMFTGSFLVDIGTMMTASVAMGVAVDDTIHFLTWFRQFIDQGKSRVEAVIETYRRVGPAMTQTTIVGGLGLFVFALSTFTPTQRFGTLMLVMLATALIGDLILLPALLAGPLGKVFRPRVGTTGAGATDPTYAAELSPSPSVRETKPNSETVDESPQVDEVPVLKVHYPTARRTDPAHRNNRQ